LDEALQGPIAVPIAVTLAPAGGTSSHEPRGATAPMARARSSSLPARGQHQHRVRLIAAGANVNHKDEKDGMPVLLVCAFKGTTQCAEALIAANADVNGCDKSGFTPLLACLNKHRLDMAKVLVRARCDVLGVSKQDLKGTSILDTAKAAQISYAECSNATEENLANMAGIVKLIAAAVALEEALK
jgi:ankyrin repeat protein